MSVEFRSPIEYGKSEILYEESDIAIIFVGHMFEEALKGKRRFKKRKAMTARLLMQIYKTVRCQDAGPAYKEASVDCYD